MRAGSSSAGRSRPTKGQVNVNTLYTALFSDLPTEKDFKIPTRPEKRERILQELIQKVNKPIVLFIDEAHELHGRTLVGPRLARHGHGITVLREHLNARRAEVRSYLCGQLGPGRTEEFNREIHKPGIL